MKKLQILWIDDETDLLTSAARDAIENPHQPDIEGRQASLKLIKVKTDKDITLIITDLAERQAQKVPLPDLVVIDQKLDVKSEPELTQRGSNVAVVLRTHVHLVPLVGVTSGQLSDFSSLQKEQFIDVLSRDSIHRFDRIPDLYAIADGFGAIKRNMKRLSSSGPQAKSLMRLMGCPPENEKLLNSCLPGQFKKPWDSDTPHSLSRWIWHTLSGRPGFLYDDFEVATMLGLAVDGFHEIAARFADCAYDGILCSGSRRRWWVSEIRNKARTLVESTTPTPLWKIGRQLLGANNQAMFSKCYGRKDEGCVPDVAAYKDQRYVSRVQAISEDTEFVESDTPPIGFEQRRVFAPR